MPLYFFGYNTRILVHFTIFLTEKTWKYAVKYSYLIADKMNVNKCKKNCSRRREHCV